MTHLKNLQSKIDDRTATCAVIGLGYVGLPLAVELAGAGFHVWGIDLDEEKVAMINRGESYIPDVPQESLSKVSGNNLFRASTDYAVLENCDTINICVPTPLRKTRDPDISYIVESLDQIKRFVHPGMLVILESTTYPGTTEEIIVPELVGKGLRIGEDIFVGFSPERVDPGNPVFQTGNIPKVVGGMTPQCTQLAVSLYSSFVENVHPVSSTRVAEMVKLLENTFRSVNIGLVNELALMCDHMGIDVWEVIEGAATKPFGFMPFFPGPGLGGHCIPIDPFYLSWKARSVGFEARFIELAGQVNQYMPQHVVNKAATLLNDHGKAVRGSEILVLGVAYKKNIDDVRESPALDIISKLIERGASVSYSDPFVPTIQLDSTELSSVESYREALQKADLVVIVTDHDDFDYDLIAEKAAAVLDTRNALRGRGTSI